MNRIGSTGGVPRVLVVGTGARGGIGRYERLLMRALDELSDAGALAVDYIWRRSHPAYLLDGSSTTELGAQNEKAIPAYALEIARATARVRPDLVLFLHVRLARVAPIVRALGVRTYAIAAYGDEVWQPLDPLCRAALNRAPGVFAISHHTASRIEEAQGRPAALTEVTPLSLDPPFVERLPPLRPRGTSLGAPKLLTVSRLEAVSRYKGIDATIRALPALVQTIGNVELHIVGDGDDRPYLEGVAAAEGVAENVVFRGFVDDEALAAAYQAADLFVLPSLEEGFGLVFLEAMAYGLPVVAANAGAAPEVVQHGETGLLVDSPEEIADALKAILADHALAERMGRASHHRAIDVFSFSAFRASVADAISATLG